MRIKMKGIIKRLAVVWILGGGPILALLIGTIFDENAGMIVLGAWALSYFIPLSLLVLAFVIDYVFCTNFLRRDEE